MRESIKRLRNAPWRKRQCPKHVAPPKQVTETFVAPGTEISVPLAPPTPVPQPKPEVKTIFIDLPALENVPAHLVVSTTGDGNVELLPALPEKHGFWFWLKQILFFWK